jgi:hypothetical protein
MWDCRPAPFLRPGVKALHAGRRRTPHALHSDNCGALAPKPPNRSPAMSVRSLRSRKLSYRDLSPFPVEPIWRIGRCLTAIIDIDTLDLPLGINGDDALGTRPTFH